MGPPDDIWTNVIPAKRQRPWYTSKYDTAWDIWDQHKGNAMLLMNKLNERGYFGSWASTSPTQMIPMITTTGQQTGGHTIFNVVVASSSASDDWSYASSPAANPITFILKNGFRIIIAQDGSGSYEIKAPENLKVEDFVRAHPNGKLLDVQGNVIQFNPDGTLRWEMLRNVSGHVIDIQNPTSRVRDSIMASSFDRIAIPASGCRLLLPDGVEVVVEHDGTYRIDDTKQTFTYKAAPRNFNRFLNASDVLEDFIRYLGSMEVRQRHVMAMPLELFVKWLIIEAAKADGDPYGDVEPPLIEGVQAVKAQPRCRFCRRFISQVRADNGVHFCSPDHLGRFLTREKLTEVPRLRSRRQRIAAPPSDFLLPVPMAASS